MTTVASPDAGHDLAREGREGSSMNSQLDLAHGIVAGRRVPDQEHTLLRNVELAVEAQRPKRRSFRLLAR